MQPPLYFSPTNPLKLNHQANNKSSLIPPSPSLHIILKICGNLEAQHACLIPHGLACDNFLWTQNNIKDHKPQEPHVGLQLVSCFFWPMELIGEKCCSNRNDRIQKVEPGNLLEECWFFGNLLNSGGTKTKMSRCNSDPCPSSNYNSQEEMFARNHDGKCSSCPSTKKHPTKLARAPSLPSFMARAVEVNQEKETTLDLNPNIGSSSSRNSLIRAPSLPPPSCVGRKEDDDDDDDEEEEDQESEFTLGRLIRQASLNSSDIFPPRHPSKSSTIPTRKHRPRKKDMEGYKEMGQQYQTNQKKMAKGPSNIQPKEAQYFKALSLNSDNQSLLLDGANKVSGLQDMGKEKLRRSNSLSDASLYLNKRSTATIPNWAAAATADNEKKSAHDMKAQIKFWARAVASNARAPGVLITNQNC